LERHLRLLAENEPSAPGPGAVAQGGPA
jgi:hypothetical protein